MTWELSTTDDDHYVVSNGAVKVTVEADTREAQTELPVAETILAALNGSKPETLAQRLADAERRAAAAEDVLGRVWDFLEPDDDHVRKALLAEHAPDYWLCPKCRRHVVTTPEAGVISHLGPHGCGYCAHVARANGVCEVCGDQDQASNGDRR